MDAHTATQTEVNQQKKKKRWPRWAWPGLIAAGAGGAAMSLLRGCWHSKMGWPMREGNHSYQVCLGCGIKRLFDEKRFRGYGPYGYDLKELIEREQAVRGSGANLPEGVVSAIEGLWDMSRTPTCAGVRFQYPDFQGIERSTCPSWALELTRWRGGRYRVRRPQHCFSR